jgi:DNA-binding CsgD family transcriptional regulator
VGLIARGLIETALMQFFRGVRPQGPVALLDRAEAFAREAADWYSLRRVFWNRGELRFVAGQLNDALADFRQVVALYERVGGWAQGPETWRAEVCLWLGAWEEARQGIGASRSEAEWVSGAVLTGGLLAWLEGDHIGALQSFHTALESARERTDRQDELRALALQADSALQLGRAADALRGAREAAHVLVKHGAWGGVGRIGGVLAEAAVLAGAADADEVIAGVRERLDATGHEIARPQLLRAEALRLRERGELDAAQSVLVESASIARAQGGLIQLGRTLAVLIEIARVRGDPEDVYDADRERAEIALRIGPEVRGLRWASGLSRLFVNRPPAGAPRLLSAREQEVAVLVARGYSNRQIGEALVISNRTAGNHVEHILNKLGLQSRAQLARWATEQELLNRRG